MESKRAVEAIAFVNDYLRGQAQLLKPSSFKVVQSGQLRSLTKRLSTCASISVDEAPAIVAEINNGEWDEVHKEMLGTAIDQLVRGGQAADSHCGTRKAQKCDFIENYLTDTDFSKILDTSVSRPRRFEACATILNHLHMPCPDPRVKRRLVAIMSSADAWMQNPINAKKCLDDLGSAIRGSRPRRAAEYVHVECFDDDPADMEARIPGYMDVYSAEAPSVAPPITSDEIDDILAGRCLRGTHKSVRDAARPPASVMTQPTGFMSPSMAMQPQLGQPMEFNMMHMMQSTMQCMFQQMARNMGSGGRGGGGDGDDLNIRFGGGGGGVNAGGDGDPSHLNSLKRSRTDNFWKRRAAASASDRQAALMDGPAVVEQPDDDGIAGADDAADDGEDEKPHTPRDKLKSLEQTMREHKAAAKGKAKAKAEPKAKTKAPSKVEPKAAAALPVKGATPKAKSKGKVMAAADVAPYKGPKVEPLLAHILCKARLDISPSRGAFCTAGSNNAERALKLKGHDAAVQKAGARRGWTLAAAYWDRFH